ncbi:UNVERIFIED_CONTAM: hypothetical protein GTU68_028889 [Idotea baltica]|nr:hypothetical protein [Idotea baltica]
MTAESQTGLIAFGSNQGDSEQIFADAIARLGRVEGIEVTRTSTAIWTPPIRGTEENASEQVQEVPDYLNAVIRIQTSLSPQLLHAETANIELEFGRVRKRRWGDRTIDLDLLLLGSQVLDSEALTLPHPRMTFRRFVLKPAAEIASELIHPIAACSIGQLFEKINSPNKTMGIAFPKIDRKELVVDQVVRMLAKSYPAWQFKKIFSEKKYFENQKDVSILVVWDPPMGALDSSSDEFWKQAFRFPGPCLRLKADSDQDKILVELRAAIQTIG